MLEVLYYNEDTIIENLAESLVIGGFPMRTDKITTEKLTREITQLSFFLKRTWKIKDILKKENKVLRINEEYDEKYIANKLKSYIKHFDTEEYDGIKDLISVANEILSDYDLYFKRGCTLGNVPTGSGHNSMFKGVQFNMVIKFPLYWLKEYQRYHFSDIISSQSTMHKILKFDLKEMFSNEVDERVIAIIEELRDEYNNETDVSEKKKIWRKIINTCPDGLHMVMGITMNYLQASSMIEQRESHKLSCWSEVFVPTLKGLPYYEYFLG